MYMLKMQVDKLSRKKSLAAWIYRVSRYTAILTQKYPGLENIWNVDKATCKIWKLVKTFPGLKIFKICEYKF